MTCDPCECFAVLPLGFREKVVFSNSIFSLRPFFCKTGKCFDCIAQCGTGGNAH